MASKTRARIRYRCGVEKCRTRFAQHKRAKREPKCPECDDTVRVRNVEEERRRELATRIENGLHCQCPAYPFPHDAGTLTMCERNADRLARIEPTREEILDYQGCLATPRSATS